MFAHQEKSIEEEWAVIVNGVELFMPKHECSCFEILEKAYRHQIIYKSPDNYLLHGKYGRYKLTDMIDLSRRQALIIIPNGPTCIA